MEYFWNEVTIKAGPTYGLLRQDTGFVLPFFLLACYKPWNLGKVPYRGMSELTRQTTKSNVLKTRLKFILRFFILY